MRIHGSAIVLGLLTVIAVPACASSPEDRIPDQQSIAALEARISQAPARNQCFLYAQLIHDMSEVSLRRYAAGDAEKASQLLVHIQTLAHKIHLTVSDNDNRLKNAEILLRHTAFRLSEMLHSGNYEDRALVEATLAQVNKAESDAMMRVFRK